MHKRKSKQALHYLHDLSVDVSLRVVVLTNIRFEWTWPKLSDDPQQGLDRDEDPMRDSNAATNTTEAEN